jgi:hypothetical protein
MNYVNQQSIFFRYLWFRVRFGQVKLGLVKLGQVRSVVKRKQYVTIIDAHILKSRGRLREVFA